MQSHEEGDYVEFRDYQWLLTEKQRLDALTVEMDKTINESQAGVRSLKAEVDSLKRAGDLMLKCASANMPYPPYATIAKDWLAAKEGKQS